MKEGKPKSTLIFMQFYSHGAKAIFTIQKQ